ncbi:MAG: DUF5916 domain-containing protein [Gemmatimonadota bacterium]
MSGGAAVCPMGCLKGRIPVSWAVVWLVLVLALPARAHHPAGPDSTRVMRAVRAAAAPRLDGILDDPVWEEAPRFGGFTQQEPDEGQPASEETDVQLAYDDEALYVGITCHHRRPGEILARLVRRDSWTEADRVAVYLDPHHDHQNAYWFLVNAAGSLEDGRISNDGQGDGAWDNTWNAVWDARAAIGEGGWTAEFRIPFHALRFSPAESYGWGLDVERRITRTKERLFWVMLPRTDSGHVSRFGHLEGIRGIQPARALEFLPYGVARATRAPAGDPAAGDLFAAAGGDLRYGITSGISLSATINPDFGQVESDPARLNLSVFEDFQEERRPFFIEGARDFATPIQLFYSRRIGRRPGHFDVPDGWDEVDAPDYTNILGALKVTGKTSGKTTFGLLQAVTAREEALIESTRVDAATGQDQWRRRRFETEPRASFLVGRAKQDLLKGNSHVGLLVTAVNRQGAEAAYTGGADWNLKWRDSAYDFSGQVAANRAETGDGVSRGWAQIVRAGKRKGWLQGQAHWESFSPGFEANDLGFQWRNDYHNASLSLQLRRDQPWWIFQRSQVDHEHWGLRSFDGVTLEHGIWLGTTSQLRSFWEFGVSTMHRFRARDDLDTRGGPLIAVPAFDEYEFWVESDSRRAISGWVSAEFGGNGVGSSWREVAGGLTLHPSTRIEVNLDPSFERHALDAQWVENVDDDGDGSDDHFVYAQLASRTLDLTTRASVLFSRDLSLELYLQPFVTVGDYRGYKELARPSSYEFRPFREPDDNPDFRVRSLHSNLVLRWEYRPGSTLFVVWSQSRERQYEAYRFRPVGDALSSFADDGTDILLVKLSYWLSM